jgi:predicted ABC-type sugar transport system permease subunit
MSGFTTVPQTRFGHWYAVGGDPEAARRGGIRVFARGET